MCEYCDKLRSLDAHALPVRERPVPYASGEGAIYTPEYLTRKEGSAEGTDPEAWQLNVI